jgi:hypothetical protein
MQDSEHSRFSYMSAFYCVDAGGNIGLGTLVMNFFFSQEIEYWDTERDL